MGFEMHITDIRKAWENFQASRWARRFRALKSPLAPPPLPLSAKGLKILLVRNDRVGDMILTTPLFPALKEAGCARLGMVASNANGTVVANNPFLESVFFDDGRPTLEPFRNFSAAYDLALDLTGDFSLRAVLAMARSGAPIRVGPSHRWARDFYTHIADVPPESLYESDRIRAQAAFLGSLSVFPPSLHPSANSRDEAAAVLARVGRPTNYLLVSLGARRKSHSLGAGWIELLRVVGSGLGLPMLLAWGPGEEGLAQKVAEGVGPKAKILSLTDVQVLGCLAEGAAVFLTLETGSFHVGVAAGARTVGIFGPLRNPRWHPPENDRLAYVEGPSLHRIRPEEVLAACRRLAGLDPQEVASPR